MLKNWVKGAGRGEARDEHPAWTAGPAVGRSTPLCGKVNSVPRRAPGASFKTVVPVSHPVMGSLSIGLEVPELSVFLGLHVIYSGHS